jgi:glycosyltransferase involved in cell wall biosynthesis
MVTATLIGALDPAQPVVVAGTEVDNALQRRIRAFTERHLSADVTPSRAAATAVETLAGLAAGSVRVIPNAVADVELRSVPRVAGGIVIGGIGRLQAEKRFDLLIRAGAQLPGVALVLVGDGPERPALEALVGELGVRDRVHFVGWRPGARDYLTSFDVFALPSRLESFGLVLLEAGLAGLPVVACRVGGVPEVVADGESGILVEPDDLPGLATALRALIDAPGLRESFGARGRLRALAFSPDEMARRYEALYRELASD